MAASLLRLTRLTMLEVINQDYVRTARSKGVAEVSVIGIHAFKNASLPIVTSLGMSFGSLLGGTVIIESIFAMPGLGTLMINAIRTKDIPQVMGSVLIPIVPFLHSNAFNRYSLCNLESPALIPV